MLSITDKPFLLSVVPKGIMLTYVMLNVVSMNFVIMKAVMLNVFVLVSTSGRRLNFSSSSEQLNSSQKRRKVEASGVTPQP
jgi:hypothetical protein